MSTPSEKQTGNRTPLNGLWVGNLSSDTTESDLIALFAKYGVLDCVASRNYAIVYFKLPDNAKAAKEALQGSLVRGNSIKIDFAKPAKQGKLLWVGGISPTVTEEELVAEFSKFGDIEKFKLDRDRNSGLVDYHKMEYAVDALRSTDGKCFGGEQIRVDFLRSQPTRRGWYQDLRDTHSANTRIALPDPSWMSPNARRNYAESSQHGQKRDLIHGGWKRRLSNVLWIKYPPDFPIDDHKLHYAMIMFGEVERIKTFPARHYSFVEFKSIDETRRAKEGLQGRLFNDSRIQIMFSHSELAPADDDSQFFPGIRGPRADLFFNEPPLRPMEVYGPIHSVDTNNYPGIPRPFTPQGFNPMHGGSNLSEKVHDPVAVNWRRLSPPALGTPHFSPGMRPLGRRWQWEGPDARDPKRVRIRSPSLIDHSPFHARRMEGPVAGAPHSDFCWRGAIAKGGNLVCNARCLPIGKGIGSPLPETINCSAKTGLDMLAKHFDEASGFESIFFLPDSEEDFASYTEFLHYMGGNNRAGVAKFDDGTTLFLVPPSDFLTNVLKLPGPERLYGIVLKSLQLSSNVAMQQAKPIIPSTSQNAHRQQLPSQTGYTLLPQNKNFALKPEYSRTLHEDSMPHAIGGNRPSSHDAVSRTAPSLALNNAVDQFPTTPDKVSSSNMQPSVTSTTQLPLNPHNPSSQMTPLMPIAKGSVSQGWSTQDHQVPVPEMLHQEHLSYAFKQPGQQFSHRTSVPSQFPNYPGVSNGSNHFAQSMAGGAQHAAAMPDRPTNNYSIPSQATPLSAPTGNQQYQIDASWTSQKSHGLTQTADGGGLFGSGLQQSISSAPCDQDQTGHLAEKQKALPSADNETNKEFPTQLSGSVQGATQGDADQNLRYQSTLQFAARLLQQMQQKQLGAQAVQGSGHQQ